MKKSIALILFLVMTVCGAGCQSTQAQPTTSDVPTTQNASAPTEEVTAKATTQTTTEATYSDQEEENTWYEEPEVDNAHPEDYVEETAPQESTVGNSSEKPAEEIA